MMKALAILIGIVVAAIPLAQAKSLRSHSFSDSFTSHGSGEGGDVSQQKQQQAQQQFLAALDTPLITSSAYGAIDAPPNDHHAPSLPPPASSALFGAESSNYTKKQYYYDSGGTAALAAAAEPAIERIPIIYDSKQTATEPLLLEANANHTISIVGAIEPPTINPHSEAAGVPLENVFHAVQHQTEKIYEGIMKLFVELVGGVGSIDAPVASSHFEEKSHHHQPLTASTSTALVVGRTPASRHAVSCFNAIDTVGPNQDALRDAIVDYHNTLRLDRCLSALNLAMADQQQQHQQLTHLTALPTLLHWDDVLVKTADKILDIGAARACRNSEKKHHRHLHHNNNHHHRHHSNTADEVMDYDLHALALKKFASFGVNAWQSHKTCSWVHVLNEWSAAAAGATHHDTASSGQQHHKSAAAENITNKHGGSYSQRLVEEVGVAAPSSSARLDQHYRQMLWKEVTSIGCAATVVDCGEYDDRTVKLYACVYNARVPDNLADTDGNMCGEIHQQQTPSASSAPVDSAAAAAATSSSNTGEVDMAPEAVSSNTFGQILKHAAADVPLADVHHNNTSSSSSSSEFGAIMSTQQNQEAAVPESNTVQIGNSAAEFGGVLVENGQNLLQQPHHSSSSGGGGSNSAVFGMIVNK